MRTSNALRGAAWAIGGLVLAVALTLGAFALAGQDISEPATVPIVTPSPAPAASVGEGADRTATPHAGPSETPSVGGGSDDGPDHSGPGSDGSGSGSDDSGSGSDHSGGSSDSSGPGSGEDHDDD